MMNQNKYGISKDAKMHNPLSIILNNPSISTTKSTKLLCYNSINIVFIYLALCDICNKKLPHLFSKAFILSNHSEYYWPRMIQ